MQVTITGAGGFIGRRLVRQLLAKGTLAVNQGAQRPIDKLLACDLTLSGLPEDPRLEKVEADTSNPDVINRIITDQTGAGLPPCRHRQRRRRKKTLTWE